MKITEQDVIDLTNRYELNYDESQYLTKLLVGKGDETHLANLWLTLVDQFDYCVEELEKRLLKATNKSKILDDKLTELIKTHKKNVSLAKSKRSKLDEDDRIEAANKSFEALLDFISDIPADELTSRITCKSMNSFITQMAMMDNLIVKIRKAR